MVSLMPNLLINRTAYALRASAAGYRARWQPVTAFSEKENEHYS